MVLLSQLIKFLKKKELIYTRYRIENIDIIEIDDNYQEDRKIRFEFIDQELDHLEIVSD
jgi:hypothetical protein